MSLIQASYRNSKIRVINNGKLSERFTVETGVRQRYLLSPMFFLLVVDWIMKTTAENSTTGIHWSQVSQLFVDDIILLSHKYQHVQEKVQSLSSSAKLTGLNIERSKTKVMWTNNI